MTISANELTPGTTLPPCTCVGVWADPGAETLRQLVASGMGQWEASGRLWGPVVPHADREAMRAWVRAEFVAAFAWLELPPWVSELPRLGAA